MMRKHVKALMGLMVATALVATGCTGPQQTPESPDGSAGAGGTANVYLYQEPAGVFGPLAPASGPDIQVNSLIFQGLIAADPDFELKPVLAESFTVSEDAKTFTFKLKPDLKWSDGEPLTSEDVMFTYNLMANPKSKAATASSYADVAGAKEVADGKASTVSGFSAPDEHTFVMKSAEPNYGLLAQIGQTYILPEHVLGDLPVDKVADDGYFRKPTVTSGPFTFDEFKTSQYVHVVANPEASPAPKLNDIYLKPMTSDVATAQLGNGGLDVAAVSPLDLETLKDFDDVEVQEKLGDGFVRIGLNQSKDYFKDKRVRQAFLYAVNRAELVKQVLNGKAEVQNSDFFGPEAPKDLEPYDYDPAKAKHLLKEAGWDSSQEINLMWIAGQRDRDSSATIVQNQLEKAGVKVKLQKVQAAELTESYNKKTFDMVLYGGGKYAADPWSVNVIAGCDQHYPRGGNINYYCNEEFDSVMRKANATVDEAERKKLYGDAARISNEDADLFWLFNAYGLWGVNKRLKGFEAPGAQEAPFWNPAAWSIGE